MDAASGAGGARFDPKDPPDGYSLCHGGHCHADDGSLVPYDEVQARLAGGPVSWKPVARVRRTTDCTIVLVTHETGIASEFATNVVLFDAACENVLAGSPGHVLSHALFHRNYPEQAPDQPGER